ncbi:hypothetical protein [Kaistia adipata]|uniref:hypothetical protein n=1 Tax=Kaistia adipata TaxID=166954 RepID=UPI0012EC5209|nr:hypothetical protein [Kaistia adipata]
MNTSSSRHRFQEVLENHLGCPEPSQLKSFRPAFEALIVDDNLSGELSHALVQDASSTYFKAALSMVEAMVSIHRGYHSWAVVKLYYASFYLVRLAFAVRRHGIFRCGTLYTLNTSRGSKPTKRPGKGDHKVILDAFIKDYESSEGILSNKINNEHTFRWLMDRRETVHYRDATFNEPDLPHFDRSLSNGELSKWISIYLGDSNLVYCFLEGHACLAVPLKFCDQILNEAASVGLINLLTPEQKNVILSLLNEAHASDVAEIKSLLLR